MNAPLLFQKKKHSLLRTVLAPGIAVKSPQAAIDKRYLEAIITFNSIPPQLRKLGRGLAADSP